MNTTRRWRNAGSILFFAVMLVACSRPQESNTSQMQLSIAGKIKSQKETAFDSDKTLAHLVLNVTSSDLKDPILFIWDAHSGGKTTTVPDNFTLEVPQGKARMIQVLAVYNNTQNQMSFYYGDITQDLFRTEEPLSVNVNLIGAGNIISGQVSGRYLSGAVAEYTGPVNIKYTPPGKPALIISKSRILQGWFNFFMLDGDPLAKFSYEVETLTGKTVLWGRAVNLSDVEFTPSQSVLKATLPVSWRKQNITGGGFSWELEEAQEFAYGFFGPGTSIQAVCRADSMTSDLASVTALDQLTVYTLTKPADNSTPANLPGSLLISSSLPTVAQLQSTSSPFANFNVKGGLRGNDSSHCLGGSEYITKMTLNSLYTILLNGHGKDGSVYHFAPFAGNDTVSNRAPVVITPAAPDFTIAGSVLPGIRDVLMDRMIIYKRVATDEVKFPEGEIPCREIDLGLNGFKKMSEYPLGGTDAFSGVALGVTAADAAAGNRISIAVCMAKGSVILNHGFILDSKTFGGGGP